MEKLENEKKNVNPWEGFTGTKWQESIDVRDFIQENYTLYEGDDSFLEFSDYVDADVEAGTSRNEDNFEINEID